jgi:hypothetical protein
MLKIELTEVFGWSAAIRGMRNAHNSWHKSDSCFNAGFDSDSVIIGSEDMKLMRKLIAAGTDDSKFMRMIHVQCDITAPLYWWKEYDTYKVGTVANSCSTMHKIADKEFTLDDFSHDHITALDTISCFSLGYTDCPHVNDWILLRTIIEVLNFHRLKYLETKDKRHWWQMIQLLPSSYNQRRTVDLNYAVLRNMYHARKNHKLDEWHDFCEWVESLPYSELITDNAHEKKIPMKPNITCTGSTDFNTKEHCPSCGNLLGGKEKYCPECGQALRRK